MTVASRFFPALFSHQHFNFFANDHVRFTNQGGPSGGDSMFITRAEAPGRRVVRLTPRRNETGLASLRKGSTTRVGRGNTLSARVDGSGPYVGMVECPALSERGDKRAVPGEH